MQAKDFLLANGGRLNPDWFAPDDVETLVSTWLNGTDPSESDALRSARVYRLAFTTLVDQLMFEPASQGDRSKRSAYLPEQLKYFKLLADEYGDAIDDLLFGAPSILVEWEGKRY